MEMRTNHVSPNLEEADKDRGNEQPPQAPLTTRRRFLELIGAVTASTAIGYYASNKSGKTAGKCESCKPNNSRKVVPAKHMDTTTPKVQAAPVAPKQTPDAGINNTASKVPQFAEAREVIGNHTFENGSFEMISSLFERQILPAKFGSAFYFTLDGKIQNNVPLPKSGNVVEWPNQKKERIKRSWEIGSSNPLWTKDKKQAWHNLQRLACNNAEAHVLPTDTEKLGYPIVSVPFTDHKASEGNSFEEIARSRLSQKLQDSRFFNGESKTVTQAIKIISTDYGIPAELVLAIGGQESTYDKKKTSNVGARGIFQLMQGAFNAGKANLKENSSFRDAPITETYPATNRFVQIELFCAYYSHIQKKLSKQMARLTSRLSRLDPNFSAEDIRELFTVTAYNAGYSRVKKCIGRFLTLNDSSIKKLIGNPPYGKNVLLGILANSFGKGHRVGKDVFFYAAKVAGWKSLLKNELKDTHTEKSTQKNIENFPANVVPAAKESLSQQLRAIRNNKHNFKRFTRSEVRIITSRSVKMTGQIALLRSVFGEFVPNSFLNRRLTSRQRRNTIKACVRNSGCWSDLQKRHAKWRAKMVDKGQLVKMDENNEAKPYFCQQIGKTRGVTNSPESLYMNKDFEPLLEALVELVNHQIDLFNQSPENYGTSELKDVKIPHITAIKISGAIRSVYHQYRGLSNVTATKDLSSHLVGHALDIGSLEPRNEDAKIVRFKEAFTVNGNEIISAGGKLPAAGFGESTRKVISKMVGRALISLMKPLKKEGISLLPLWEHRQKNWHITIGRK